MLVVLGIKPKSGELIEIIDRPGESSLLTRYFEDECPAT